MPVVAAVLLPTSVALHLLPPFCSPVLPIFSPFENPDGSQDLLRPKSIAYPPPPPQSRWVDNRPPRRPQTTPYTVQTARNQEPPLWEKPPLAVPFD
ncbi:hypothetical protein BO71DRAFT_399636 [Aspergillus ellipticus CBS 707.79]|uniref:Secreted protein n=1 Tax=Aspergillus ellipticus CBS 707.79 TaxID=1448320 RepID=A0A319D7S8_9EURO|nr:hypothetical protein BO71DRAFT_399636 [Aspergillus ellipticus CBS 707.79]